LPKAWTRERRRDYYHKKAKQEKYRSRAAYKLFQIVEKYGFIENGDIVVDLGSAPGGWVQAARKIVGNKGFVLGVDKYPMESFSECNIITIRRDITREETLQQILELLPGKADAVISDVSQNLSGVWEVDHARQIDLAQRAMEIAVRVLKTNGNFFTKAFQGDMFRDFVKKLELHFKIVKIVKPKASRAKSSEMYVLGLKYMSN